MQSPWQAGSIPIRLRNYTDVMRLVTVPIAKVTNTIS
jgi:hypothetical protein